MIQPKNQADGGLQAIKEDAQMEDLAGSKKAVLLEKANSSGSVASDEEQDMAYRSCEEVDSDELDGGLNLSEDEAEASNFRAMNKVSK